MQFIKRTMIQLLEHKIKQYEKEARLARVDSESSDQCGDERLAGFYIGQARAYKDAAEDLNCLVETFDIM